MKYGNHENYCNGTGDCSCGQDNWDAARGTIDRALRYSQELDEQEIQIRRLKSQVRYWKWKARLIVTPKEE